jgi:TRAP-type C4-dicarboxylate transport system permease small subunit
LISPEGFAVRIYRRVLEVLALATGYLCALLMAVLSVVVFLGVFSRYLINDPWQWTEEAARITFLWVVFLGASVGVRRGLHFRFTLLLDNLRPAWKRPLELFANLWVIFFAGIMAVKGFSFAVLNFAQLTPTLVIPWGWVYMAVPLSGALMILYALEHLRGLMGSGQDAPLTDSVAGHEEARA